MKKEDINLLRANIIGGMDAYIRDVIGDEFVTERWLMCGMPDGETEEDLLNDVDDEENFKDWVKLFAKLLDK